MKLDILKTISEETLISMIELYAKLKKNKSYKRHPCSLFRLLRKMGFFKNKKKEREKIPT